MDVQHYMDKKMKPFISPDSKRFFHRFLIPATFLEKDPSAWNDDSDFKIRLNINAQCICIVYIYIFFFYVTVKLYSRYTKIV